MKKMFLFFNLFFFFATVVSYSQESSFKDLLIQKELNPSVYHNAKEIAVSQKLPVSIKLPDGILIDVIKEENGTILYSVIKNLAHPFSDGEILSFNQISNRYDLSTAEINWGIQTFEANTQNQGASQLLLVPDWTNDNVIAFDPLTGDLVDENYIPSSPGNLASPKHALLNDAGFISVSDQLTDLVQKFDTSGSYLGIFAPAGGVNNAILDNLRGHAYRPNGNLVVTVGSGGNQNGVAEFDNSGNYLGNFIAIGSGGLSSPFCILFRDNDVLVTGSSSDAAHRYDLNGNYISDLITGINFPQHIIELSNGNLALAVFSLPSGLGIYDSTGTQLNFFTSVTGLRSVYQLPGGNYLVTNGGGLHEIDGTTGSLIRTIYAASNLQYISLIDFSVIPVELTSFSAESIGNDVLLKWSTASETNNHGFQIERKEDEKNWINVAFINGSGTTSIEKNYSYNDTDLKPGFYTYRLKQLDFDGSFEYSETIEVEVNMPMQYSLDQNYPNPFNPETTIKYNLPFDSNVKITLYNSLGEQINELVKGINPAGAYEINFNADDYSSGVYFYSIEALSVDGEKNFRNTKKMLLVK